MSYLAVPLHEHPVRHDMGCAPVDDESAPDQ